MFSLLIKFFFLSRNYHAELFAFGKRLGEEFRKDLLQRAFTHRSYIVQEEMRQKEVGIEDPKLSLEDNQEFIRRGETLMSEYLKCHLRVALPRFPEEGIWYALLISVIAVSHIVCYMSFEWELLKRKCSCSYLSFPRFCGG